MRTWTNSIARTSPSSPCVAAPKKCWAKSGASPPRLGGGLRCPPSLAPSVLPRFLDELIELRDYKGLIRQVTVTDLGHEEPTVLLTNQLKLSCPALVTRYAHRMLIENGTSQAIQFF